MIVVASENTVVVHEADDCTRLHVSCALTSSELDAVLNASGLGCLGKDASAELSISALHQLAKTAASEKDWELGWQKMLAYAGKSGWISDDGHRLLAHVETPHSGFPHH